MSSVQKMQIRGIRSFGIDKEDEQVIRFTSPLTLIVGANGCGKTTIIECLKYAITGELPPGSNKGQSFIHDPKIFKTMECLGQVKLKVTNTIGNSLTCTRSMKTTKTSNSGIKFVNIDNTVHFETPGGALSTISVKASDATDQMCQAMGVSKAILNNVIFCHQEDSLWPLDEGKKLKEKFDAIFGTTEYNKAIEKIIKHRKKRMDKLTILKNGDLKYKAEYKKIAAIKTMKLESINNEHSKLEKVYESLDEKIAPIDVKIQNLREAGHKANKLKLDLLEITKSLELKRKMQLDLRADIKEIYEGSTEQLKNELDSFKKNMEANKAKLRVNNTEYSVIQEKVEKIQVEITKNEGDSKKLLYQREEEQEWNDIRGKKVKELCEKLMISCPEDSESLENVDTIMPNIDRQISYEEQVLENMKKSHDEEMQKMQENINELIKKKTTLENGVLAKKNQEKELEAEYWKLQKDIDVGEKSLTVLSQLNATIETSGKSLEEYTQNSNLAAIKAVIVEEKKNKDALQAKQAALDKEIVFLNSISSITTEIDIKQREIIKKNYELTRIKNKHSQNLRTLFPTRTIERNYKSNLNSLLEELQRSQSDYTKRLNEKQIESNSFKQKRMYFNEQLKLKETELRNSKNQIDEKCNGQEYLDVLSKSKEKSEKLEMDCGLLRSSKLINNRYISNMTKDPCCPLCHKDMDAEEVNDLTTEIQVMIKNLPRDLEVAEKSYKDERCKYDELLSLKFAYDSLDKLKEDIEKTVTTLKEIDEKFRESQTEIESLEMALLEPKANLQLIQSMVGDMSILDECVRDLAKKSEDIEVLKRKLPAEATSTRTSEEAQTERMTVTADFNVVYQKIESLQTQHDSINDQIQKERDSLNDMIKQRNSLLEVTQNLSNKRNRYKDIGEIKKNLETELKNESNQIRPLQQKLQAFQQERSNLNNENTKKTQIAQVHLEKLRAMNNEITRITGDIKKRQQLNLKIQIANLAKKHIDLNSEKTNLIGENKKRAQQINLLTKELSNQELNERGLRDNVILREHQKDEKEMEAQQAVLAQKQSEMNFEQMVKEMNSLEKEKENITTNRAQVHGKRSQLEVQIKEISIELNQPEYRSANLNYLKAFYEATVLQKIVDDLGKYRSALERALMNYHSQKMDQINRTIRSLWTTIYRGNDIDYIQIKTDEQKETNADKKRTYNYRVVHCKNSDVEIDMRGHCSAGQKVLASLIIRMALAETFSHNCGVLALDEPTTNLDQQNISSLCEALCTIIGERQTSQSFMLIIITHDEEFVTAMDKVERYYRLSRTDAGKSVITEMNN